MMQLRFSPGFSNENNTVLRAVCSSLATHGLSNGYLIPMPPHVDVRDVTKSNTEVPSFFWRSASFQTLLGVSGLCRFFLFTLNKTEVNGLPKFLDLLKSRANYRTRRKGLVTVSNHISVIDDPLIWGVLPFSYAITDGYMNHRWSFGSHDICFKGMFRSNFFSLGQVLPTHRMQHSPHGGPFQATMTEAIRMLSRIQTNRLAYSTYDLGKDGQKLESANRLPTWPFDCVDPFSDLPVAPSYPSRPNDDRWYLAPSRYACNSYSWIHIFPEGMIHQSKEKTMRYFKWGVSRLILEPIECPDVVPIFIQGTDQVMHESRTFPRFLPRIGKNITVTFGEPVDAEARFGDLRRRWREIVDEQLESEGWDKDQKSLTYEVWNGILPDSLALHNEEVWELRKECTRRVREEVLKIRRSRGLPDIDPKSEFPDTWREEGPKREGKMEDDTWIGHR